MLSVIQDNPYRFLGICSNSPAREKVTNTNRLKAYLKVGKEVTFPLDLTSHIAPIVRTQEGMDAANNKTNLPKDQLKYALFWFVNDTPIDKMALEYLQTGNSTKVIELWKKKETATSLINLGVLNFILGNNGDAIGYITKAIHNDEYLSHLIELVCGATFQISEDEVAKLFIESLKEEIPVKDLAKLFSEFGVSQDDDDLLAKLSIDGPISSINSEISNAKSVKNDDADAQYAAGVRLMNNTKSDLATIRTILGEGSPQYQIVADALAKQILQCGINYYNNSSEDEDVEIDKAFTLQNYALSIAVGKLTKDRCKDNVEILKKKKNELPPKEARYYHKLIMGELNKYSSRSTTIANAIDLIKACAPFLASIKEALGANNTYYLRMSTLIVSAALHNVIEVFNNSLNDNIKFELIVNRVATLAKIRTMFNEAWKATLYMDKLDMESDFRSNRYNPNRASLKNQVQELIDTNQSVRLSMRSETQIFNACSSIADYQKYMSTFPGGKFTAQAQSKIEKIEFDACKSTQDCDKFKKKYPNTTLPINDKWEECYFNCCTTIEWLQKYLQAYPKGRYVTQAKNKIDDMTFQSCRSTSDYKRYISKFPNGRHKNDANQIIADEECWANCVNTDTKAAYKDYLAKFPNGRHKQEAESKAKACYIATMVYGDYNHPQVVALREFRDNTLQSSWLGRTFIKYYYRYSPKLVELLQNKTCINKVIKKILDKFITLYKHEDK